MNDIKCNLCKKEIENDDEILLASKDDYNSLPDDVKTENIIFLHTECYANFKKNEDEKNGERKD